jgi:hypothetical protein
MEYEQIRTERRGDVMLLLLNRPDRLNAWTPRMTAELTHAIEAADADAGIGAVVLSGEGRGFYLHDGKRRPNPQLPTARDPTAEEVATWRDRLLLIRSTDRLLPGERSCDRDGSTMILSFDRIVVAEGASSTSVS